MGILHTTLLYKKCAIAVMEPANNVVGNADSYYAFMLETDRFSQGV